MKKRIALALVLLSAACAGCTALQPDPGNSIPDSATTPYAETAPVPTTPPVTTPPESEPPHTHSYIRAQLEPTCAEKGYTVYVCACGDAYQENELPALGHTWGDWAQTQPATTEAEGLMERVCAVCQAVETQPIPKLVEENHVHSYSQEITQAATCQTPGEMTLTCTACGHSYTNAIPKADHTYAAAQTVAPTCETGGYTVYTCTLCQHTYQGDTTGALSHSFGPWETTVAPTQTATGTAVRACTRCGKQESRTLDRLSPDHVHSYQMSVATPPTCEQEGVAVYQCACGDSYTQSLSRTGHEWVATNGKDWYDRFPEAEVWDFSNGSSVQGSAQWRFPGCTRCGKVDTSQLSNSFPYSDYDAAYIMLDMVNDLRRDVLGEGYDLVLSGDVMSVSITRAQQITTNFSHDGVPGWCGENIAMGYSSFQSVFNAWVNSPGHYANLVNPDYQRFGFAHATGTDGYDYWVQNFAY